MKYLIGSVVLLLIVLLIDYIWWERWRRRLLKHVRNLKNWLEAYDDKLKGKS